jgi:hypothetical protein
MDMTPLKTKQPDTMILVAFQGAKPPQAPGSRLSSLKSIYQRFITVRESRHEKKD